MARKRYMVREYGVGSYKWGVWDSQKQEFVKTNQKYGNGYMTAAAPFKSNAQGLADSLNRRQG